MLQMETEENYQELPYYDARELQSCSNLFPNMPTNHMDTEMQNISSKATHQFGKTGSMKRPMNISWVF